MAFVGKVPHPEAMTILQPYMGGTSFVRWRVMGNELPLRGDDALMRMPPSRP